MPQDWVPPDVAMTHRGINVYHIYRDDDYQAGWRENWYTLSICGNDSDNHGETGVFDVRELPEIPEELEEKYEAMRQPRETDDDDKIRYAIDSGYFDDWPDIDDDNDPEDRLEEGYVEPPKRTRAELLEAFWDKWNSLPYQPDQVHVLQTMLGGLSEDQLAVALSSMETKDVESTTADPG